MYIDIIKKILQTWHILKLGFNSKYKLKLFTNKMSISSSFTHQIFPSTISSQIQFSDESNFTGSCMFHDCKIFPLLKFDKYE